MILYRNTVSLNELVTKTLSELLLFNAKKDSKNLASTHLRHSLSREPASPLYVGLSIHSETRCKTMIEKFSKLCLSISYKRVMGVEQLIFQNICKQFEEEGLVCPRNLRKGIYTVGALDNFDHNPSSTSAEGSFHGTAISIIQPRSDGILGEERPISFGKGPFKGTPVLPETFSLVPAISIKQSSINVPLKTVSEEGESTMDIELEKEYEWINHATGLLQKHIEAKETISWAAYHASLEGLPSRINPKSVIGMLPLFFEKADSPSMVKHGMDLLKKITEFLNPGQIPVLTCDCPIFAQLKYIQWKWPSEYGEDKFVGMFAGMHIEKALMTCLGDLLNSSGWTKSLVQATITTDGKADSLLKAAHIMRARQAHQLTALALAILRQEAYSSICTAQPQVPFALWVENMKATSPTFFFWDLVLQIELKYFMFVRAHRQRNFKLYIEVLESLMFLFFALDHQNYSRWVSVHLRDMRGLPESVRKKLSENWTVHKTNHRFSDIPLDQAHEQENAKLKGKGGVIGLTENPIALRKWVITGPEVSRVVGEFEEMFLTDKTTGTDYNSNYYQHHDESLFSQENFQEKTLKLVEVINDYGNPFTDDCKELLVLDSRDCANEKVITSLQQLEIIGKEQYHNFKKNVLESGSTMIQEPIKKNPLPMFRTPKDRKQSKSNQLKDLRDDVSLCGVGNEMPICNQEEADYRLVTHVVHALKPGFKSIVVRSNDTDVMMILLGHFFTFRGICAEVKIWIAFGMEKHFALYSLNDWCDNYGIEMCHSLPMFHSFTGCDNTSSFLKKGKTTAWNTLKIFSEVHSAFKFVHDNPFVHINMDSEVFKLLQRFVILMYDRNSNLESVNRARRELFCKQNRNLENLPPTEDALLLHVKRAIFQASIWYTAAEENVNLPSPEMFGWKNDDGVWAPVWTTISAAASACKELIKCCHKGKEKSETAVEK